MMKNRLTTIWITAKKDKGLLLLCLLLAFLVWQSVRKTIGFEVPVANVGVEIEVPRGWAVLEKSVNEVDILFSGSREDVRYLNNKQLRMVIPVQDPKYGEEIRVELENRFLRNPTSAKAVEFNPSTIFIKLDQESDRLLPVKAELEGVLPEGLQIEKIVCVPASAKVSGARKILENMDSIQSAPINLKGHQSSFKESVHVSLPKSGRLRVEPERVSVEVTLTKQNTTQVIREVPIYIACLPGLNRTVETAAKTVDVTLRGQQNIVEAIRPTDLFAYVNCSDLDQAADYEVPVSIDVPSNVILLNVSPPYISVSLMD